MEGNFRTRFDSRPRYYQPPGSPMHTLYSGKVSPSGEILLEEVGEENLYAQIQSHAESVDINVLLRRFAAGDPDALTRMQGLYGDFTDAPHTFAEALNTVIAAQHYFDSLPLDVRRQFDFNFNRFIASMDSPDFLKSIGLQSNLEANAIPVGVGASVAASEAQNNSPVSTPAPPSAAPSAVPPPAAT